MSRNFYRIAGPQKLLLATRADAAAMAFGQPEVDTVLVVLRPWIAYDSKVTRITESKFGISKQA
jgi:hypothetical protein